MVLKTMKISKKLIAVLFIVLFVGCTSKSEHSAIIKNALSVMKESAAKMGQPSVVNDSLFFGTSHLNNNFDLVDALQAQFLVVRLLFL